MDLLLTIPEQSQFSNPLVELSAKRVQQWVDELPLLNVAHSVSALKEALDLLNQEPLSDKERLKLLEIYRVPVETVFKSFDRSNLRHIPLSPEERQQVVADMGKLCQTLAGGYKLVVQHGFDNGVELKKDASVLMALRRAIEALSLSMMHAFRMYAPVPMFACMEINQLFYFAEQSGVQDVACAAHKKDKNAPSVSQLYKQIMLLAITDPYRLSEGEADKVFTLLEKYTSDCIISSDTTAHEGEGFFCIDLDADSTPVKFSKDAVARGEVMRIIDARPVMEKISSADEETDELTNKISPHLQAKDLQRKKRYTADGNIKLAVGVEDIHALLSVHKHHKGKAPQLMEWSVVNESAGGFMLRSQTVDAEAIKVDDIVGIEDAGQRLMVAIVRWLRSEGTSTVGMGVEFIPAEVEPVLCKFMSAVGEEQFVGGLFLPRIKKLNLASSLMLPTGYYEYQKTVTLFVGEREMEVRMDRSISQTSGSDWFSFMSA